MLLLLTTSTGPPQPISRLKSNWTIFLRAFQSLFLFFEVHYSPFLGCFIKSILSTCIHQYTLHFSISYAALITTNSTSIILLCIQTMCISCQWTDDSDHLVHSLVFLFNGLFSNVVNI
jgi:hypothetical protein